MAMTQGTQRLSDKLGGVGMGERWEGGSRGSGLVYSMLIHIDMWQTITIL